MRIFSFVLLSLFVGTISYKIGQWQGFPISKSLIRKTIAGGLATLTISAGPLTSLAEEWTDRNRLAAETWRAVDEIFYDRTFNGNDWFQLRQEVVKKSYKNDEEVYQSLQTMLAELGDKYTRYLTPAQYSALLNSATGELVGLGVELVSESEDPTAKPSTIVANVQEESPAAEMGIMKGDKIINVDGTSAIGLSPEEVASIIRFETYC